MTDDIETTVGEALGFDPEEAIKQEDLSRDELLEFADAAMRSLINTYNNSRINADEHTLDLDSFFDVRENGDSYMTKTELASLTQLFDAMARKYDRQKSRIESLEEHRDYNKERIDELEKEREQLKTRINELENRSLLDYLW